jgi:ribosome biogenesis protein MAK21
MPDKGHLIVNGKNLQHFQRIVLTAVRQATLSDSAKMGKHRKPSGKGPGPAVAADSDMLPAFDEKALSALTEKIEKGFGKSKAPHQLGSASNGNQKNTKPGNGQPDTDPRVKTTKSEQKRGTKRDAQGNVKAAGKGKNEKNSRESKHKTGDGKGDREALLKEILALGGTEEDLDLVAGAASDDEDVGGNDTSAQDKSLKQDLAKFVAGLGIESAAVEDASEPEAEVEDDDEEEWEEASDLDESDAPDEAPKKPVAALPEVKKSDASKGPNRLVSTNSATSNCSD